MFEELPEVLTLKQCQKALQIGRNSILKLIDSGELKAFKLMGNWRVLKSELIVFVKSI